MLVRRRGSKRSLVVLREIRRLIKRSVKWKRGNPGLLLYDVSFIKDVFPQSENGRCQTGKLYFDDVKTIM